MNLDQTRASAAYQDVSFIERDTKDRDKKSYGTLALKLPALIRTAGLCQALHFIHARAKGDASKPEMHLLSHLATQLHRVDSTIPERDANKLCHRTREANMREYLHLTREAIATAQWYARLSKSILRVDETSDLEDPDVYPRRQPQRDAPRHATPDRPPRRDGGPPQHPNAPPVDARRKALRDLDPAPTTHAGLWLDRFLPKQPKATNSDEDKGTIQAHIKRLADIKVPDTYRHHFKRWEDHLTALGEANVLRSEATVQGRMIIGLGAESVLETAIHLHHTYGVPVIPGSALKGLTANYARNHLNDPSWHKSKDGIGASYRALFGDTTEAGCVIFHDALWIPPSGGEDKDKLPLDLDVMTVHHRGYYGTHGQEPPADSDDPNPVSFVTAHGKYLIALEGPPAWTDAAMSLLQRALAEMGIGAKTAAGYGRLDLNYNSPAEAERQARERAAEEFRKARERAAEEARKARERAAEKIVHIKKDIAKLKGSNANSEVPHLIAQIKSLPAEEQARLAQECIRQLGGDHKKARKDGKSWALELDKLREDQP